MNNNEIKIPKKNGVKSARSRLKDEMHEKVYKLERKISRNSFYILISYIILFLSLMLIQAKFDLIMGVVEALTHGYIDILEMLKL